MNPKLILLTSFAMIAFAANSILGRLALIDPSNSPLSFTLIRLLSGAVILLPFVFTRTDIKNTKLNVYNLFAAFCLFSYALLFSIAYVQIDTGTGALILFSCVQITMMTAALLSGQKMASQEKIGFSMALGGFIYLLLPGATSTPPLIASAFMAFSGLSWGVYTLIGKKAEKPILSTAYNFTLTVPAVLILLYISPFKLSKAGLVYAVISGALTSGLGYVLWYITVKKLKTSTASIVQLTVPALAALGGTVFLSESLSQQLIIASLLIFTGIYIKVKPTTKERV